MDHPDDRGTTAAAIESRKRGRRDAGRTTAPEPCRPHHRDAACNTGPAPCRPHRRGEACNTAPATDTKHPSDEPRSTARYRACKRGRSGFPRSTASARSADRSGAPDNSEDTTTAANHQSKDQAAEHTTTRRGSPRKSTPAKSDARRKRLDSERKATIHCKTGRTDQAEDRSKDKTTEATEHRIGASIRVNRDSDMDYPDSRGRTETA